MSSISNQEIQKARRNFGSQKYQPKFLSPALLIVAVQPGGKTTAGGWTDRMMTCRVSTLCAWELNPDGTDWSVGQTRRKGEMFNVKVALRILLGTKDYIKFKSK